MKCQKIIGFGKKAETARLANGFELVLHHSNEFDN